MITSETEVADLGREQRKAETDVQQVRDRAARDRVMIDSGRAGAKDLENLQRELDSLARRQSDLEDVELEVMERLEGAEARAAAARGERDQVAVTAREATARRDAAQAEIDTASAATTQRREQLSASLPADLLALYEKVRAGSGGIGAARLHQRRCEGCRLELGSSDLSRIRSAAPEEVVRCDECRRILVRTPESGL